MQTEKIVIKERMIHKRKHCKSIFHYLILSLFILQTLSACGSMPSKVPSLDKAENKRRFAVTDNGMPEGWKHLAVQLDLSCMLALGDTLWAGGADGLYRITVADGTITPVLKAGKRYSMVRSLLSDGENTLWIGHENGLDRIKTDESAPTTVLMQWQGKSIGLVYDLAFATDGSLWAGTYTGAYNLKEDQVQRLSTEDGLLSDMVNVLMEDNAGFFWFGSYIAKGGGLTCFNADFKEKWTFTQENGLADNFITSLSQDANGDVWAGTGAYTIGGAARFSYQDKQWEPVQTIQLADGLAGEKVRTIYEDANGYHWFCSEYDGIAIFDPAMERIGILTKEEGLTDNEVKQVQPDKGNLWLLGRRGIVFIPATWLESVLWQ